MKKTFDRMKAACCLAAAVCCLASCDEGTGGAAGIPVHRGSPTGNG